MESFVLSTPNFNVPKSTFNFYDGVDIGIVELPLKLLNLNTVSMGVYIDDFSSLKFYVNGSTKDHQVTYDVFKKCDFSSIQLKLSSSSLKKYNNSQPLLDSTELENVFLHYGPVLPINKVINNISTRIGFTTYLNTVHYPFQNNTVLFFDVWNAYFINGAPIYAISFNFQANRIFFIAIPGSPGTMTIDGNNIQCSLPIAKPGFYKESTISSISVIDTVTGSETVIKWYPEYHDDYYSVHIFTLVGFQIYHYVAYSDEHVCYQQFSLPLYQVLYPFSLFTTPEFHILIKDKIYIIPLVTFSGRFTFIGDTTFNTSSYTSLEEVVSFPLVNNISKIIYNP